MRVHEFEMMCSVCTDKSHANMKLNEMERIGNQLRRYVKQEVSYDVHNTPASYVKHDSMHCHFRCGRCPKFDFARLNRVERVVHENAYSIVCNIKDGKLTKAEIYEVLRILQGNYPMIFRIVDESRREC